MATSVHLAWHGHTDLWQEDAHGTWLAGESWASIAPNRYWMALRHSCPLAPLDNGTGYLQKQAVPSQILVSTSPSLKMTANVAP